MEKPLVGGQAVIEGVLMMNKDQLAIAVRKSNGEIKIKKEEKKKFFTNKIFKKPFVRGFTNLIETLVIGIKALNYSANEAMDEEDDKISTWQMVSSLFFAIIFSIALFIILPLFLTEFLTSSDGFLFNIIDGIIRIAIFIIYILGISFMSDIKRVFEYHGAEHKAVHCFESGKELTPENAQTFSCLHPRCGTTFVILVLVISVLVFSIVTHPSWIVKFLARIIFIPLIASVSYELLHLGAKHIKNKVVRAIIYPGMLLQKLTTRTPSLKQLEVAIAALKAVL
jgi:uncharacterized protein YqhQ